MPAADPLIWIFAFVVACATGLALVAVRGAGSLPLRTGAVGLMALLVAGGYAGLAELMSRPKPASLEWVRGNAAQATVAASHLRENEAIYLWLVFEGESEPRAYRLPWSPEMARELKEAEGDAVRRQSHVRMNRPFGGGRKDSERVFHAPPRLAMPSKRAG